MLCTFVMFAAGQIKTAGQVQPQDLNKNINTEHHVSFWLRFTSYLCFLESSLTLLYFTPTLLSELSGHVT